MCVCVCIYIPTSYRDCWVRAFTGINTGPIGPDGVCQKTRLCVTVEKFHWDGIVCDILLHVTLLVKLSITRPKSSSHITAQKTSMGLINILLLSPKSVPGDAGHA